MGLSRAPSRALRGPRSRRLVAALLLISAPAALALAEEPPGSQPEALATGDATPDTTATTDRDVDVDEGVVVDVDVDVDVAEDVDVGEDVAVDEDVDATTDADMDEDDPAPTDADPDERRLVAVTVGGQTIIEAPGVLRVSVGDPSIADVHVIDDREILVAGVSHGRTTLHVWLPDEERSYLVEVSDAGRLAEVREAIEVLGLGEHVEARLAGRRIVLDGRLDTVESLERYQMLVESLPDAVDLVRVDPAVLEEMAARIQAALLEAEIETVEVRVVGGTLFLEGSVTDEEELRRVEAIVDAIHDSVDRSALEAE